MKYIRLKKVDKVDKRKGFKVGDIFEFNFWLDGETAISKNGDGFLYHSIEVFDLFQNRDFLRDFVSLNQIKTTLVSRSLGYSRNWLTQAMNRTDRGDLTDEELQAIMKQLHVDWTQETFVHVKATKTHSAYRTRPCVYEHAKHKELLQRAFWDGRIVNGR